MAQLDALRRAPAGEPFLPFPAPPSVLGAASAARSTLVTTSIQSLRARGFYDRYQSALTDPRYRDVLLTAVAGTWIPIEAAVAHYQACDTLGFGASDQLAISMEVGDRVHGTFLGTMVRMAKTVGVTAWPALAQSAKLYERLFCGGGVAVTKRGPKDALVEIVGNPLCAIEYFRVGVRGVYQAGLQLFCSHVATFELSARRGHQSMAVRIAWV